MPHALRLLGRLGQQVIVFGDNILERFRVCPVVHEFLRVLQHFLLDIVPGGSVRGERTNFTKLVLGCIEATFCK